MTMSDDQVDELLTLEQRKAIIASIPWVAYAPGVGARCEALRSGAPVKAYWMPDWTRRTIDDPVAMKHRCKNAGHWVFVGLDDRIYMMCFTHLFFTGVFGSMEEEARYQAWARTQRWYRLAHGEDS